MVAYVHMCKRHDGVDDLSRLRHTHLIPAECICHSGTRTFTGIPTAFSLIVRPSIFPTGTNILLWAISKLWYIERINYICFMAFWPETRWPPFCRQTAFQVHFCCALSWIYISKTVFNLKLYTWNFNFIQLLLFQFSIQIFSLYYGNVHRFITVPHGVEYFFYKRIFGKDLSILDRVPIHWADVYSTLVTDVPVVYTFLV